MIRMSRAGRKDLMLRALAAYNRKHKGGCLKTADLAHAAGLMSSSNVVKMLRELEQDGKVTEVSIEPYYNCGYTVRAWQLAQYKQMELPERYIVINGEKWLVSAERLS